MASIRHMTQTYSQRIKQFLGVNESPTGDNDLKAGEAEYIRNWQITQDGKLRTRPGTRLVNRASTISNMYGQPVRGMWTGYLNGTELFVFAHCGRVWYATPANVSNDLPTFSLATGTIEDTEADFFEMNNVLYILTENNYYSWAGPNNSVTAITADNAYAPLIAVDCSPSGSYEVQEIPNLLTARRRVWFSPDGTSDTFTLPELASSIVSVTYRSTGASISYTAVEGYDSKGLKGYTGITLSSAYPQGMNTIEVEYVSADVYGGSLYQATTKMVERSFYTSSNVSISNGTSFLNSSSSTLEDSTKMSATIFVPISTCTFDEFESTFKVQFYVGTVLYGSFSLKQFSYYSFVDYSATTATSGVQNYYCLNLSATKGDSVSGSAWTAIYRTIVQLNDGESCSVKIMYTGYNTIGQTVEGTLTENRNKILHMTHHEFFAGGSDNYVFLYGDNSNVIYYSDVDTDGNPRADYFPSMDEVFVGSAGSPVTALIRHYGYLLAFKPDECYRIGYEGVSQIDGGYSQNVFTIKPVNRSVGCSAMAQAVLVNNNPRTPFENALMEWTLSYSSTTVNRDERNAKRISDRVWEEVKSMELSAVKCFDDETRHEYWCTDGTTSLIHNYARDAWTVYTGIAPTCFATWQGDLYLGTASGYVVRMSEDYTGDQNISPATYTFKNIPYVTTIAEREKYDISCGFEGTNFYIYFGGSLKDLNPDKYYSTITSQNLYLELASEGNFATGALTTYVISSTLTVDGNGDALIGDYRYIRIANNSSSTLASVRSSIADWLSENPNGKIRLTSLAISPGSEDTTNSPSITATWRSGSIDVGYPYLNKWDMELYVGLLPDGGKKLTVSAVTDRKTDLAQREITTGTSGDTPHVHHVRIRAKQWAYLKEQLQTSESPVTVTSLDTLYRTGTSGRRGLS